VNVPTADVSNFNRFLVSVGLVALVLAFAVPWTILRERDLFSIKESDLATYSQRGEEALRHKQQIAEDLQDWAPETAFWFFGSLAGLCLGVGGMRLHARQKKEDEKFDREVALLASPSSVKEQASSREDDAALAETADGPPQSRGVQSRVTAQKIAEIEEKVKTRLLALDLPDYEYRPELTIQDGRTKRTIVLDGLIQSQRRGLPDVVLEIKYSSSARARWALFADRLIALLAQYKDITRRSGEGWLVVVVPNDVSEDERVQARGVLVSRLETRARVTVVREIDIPTLTFPFDPPAVWE
jgi:hypothetical protein